MSWYIKTIESVGGSKITNYILMRRELQNRCPSRLYAQVIENDGCRSFHVGAFSQAPFRYLSACGKVLSNASRRYLKVKLLFIHIYAYTLTTISVKLHTTYLFLQGGLSQTQTGY